MRFVKYLLRISCFLVLKSWQILWKIPAKDFTSVVTLQTGNIKLYKTELHHRFLEFSVTSEKVCQSLEEHLSSTTPLRDHLIIRQRYFFFFFFNSTRRYVALGKKRCNHTHKLYLTFWNCYPLFYWNTVLNKKNNVTQCDRLKCFWFIRPTWTDLRWSIFAKIYFSKIRFL